MLAISQSSAHHGLAAAAQNLRHVKVSMWMAATRASRQSVLLMEHGAWMARWPRARATALRQAFVTPAFVLRMLAISQSSAHHGITAAAQNLRHVKVSMWMAATRASRQS